MTTLIQTITLESKEFIHDKLIFNPFEFESSRSLAERKEKRENFAKMEVVNKKKRKRDSKIIEGKPKR